MFCVVAANLAHAQTVFKCVGTKGNSYFTRGECGDKNATKTRFAPLSAADRQVIAKNMDVPLEAVKDLESICLQGFVDRCMILETYKTKTNGQTLAEDMLRVQAACDKGDRKSCQNLSSFRDGEQDQKVRLDAKCSAGDKKACDTRKRYKGLCVEGDAQSCKAFYDSLK